MIRKVAIGLALVVIAFSAYVASRPGPFHIERSLTMKAPAALPYARVADLHAWAAWSPWEGLDPMLKKTYSGPASGVGARYAWAGNSKAGEGVMTVVAAQPSEQVTIDLEFIKPFAAKNIAKFVLKASGDDTTVTWSMDGNNNFMGKAASVFMNMDKMVGDDFERGLATLKGLSEADAQKRALAAKTAADEAAKAAAVPAPTP